jgi:hypothetical protein
MKSVLSKFSRAGIAREIRVAASLRVHSAARQVEFSMRGREEVIPVIRNDLWWAMLAEEVFHAPE